MAVIRNYTNKHPIFLGPMLFHSDGKTETYLSFFYHLLSVLDANGIHRELLDEANVIFGSDKEKAIVNALHAVFHSSGTCQTWLIIRKFCTILTVHCHPTWIDIRTLFRFLITCTCAVLTYFYASFADGGGVTINVGCLSVLSCAAVLLSHTNKKIRAMQHGTILSDTFHTFHFISL